MSNENFQKLQQAIEKNNLFYSMKYSHEENGQPDGYHRITIDAANLPYSFEELEKQGLKLKTRMLMVPLTAYGASTLMTAPAESFKNIQALAFIDKVQTNPDERIRISDTLIEWLATLPVETVAFNRGGYNAIDLAKVENHPKLKGRVFIKDDIMEFNPSDDHFPKTSLN